MMSGGAGGANASAKTSFTSSDMTSNSLAAQRRAQLHASVNSPPFETPTMERLICNYLSWKWWRKRKNMHPKDIIEVYRSILEAINHLPLPVPPRQRNYTEKQMKADRTLQKAYAINYKRWVKFCGAVTLPARSSLRQSGAGNTVTMTKIPPSHTMGDRKFKPSALFGRTMLRIILPLVRDRMIKQKDLPREKSTVLSLIFRELDKELGNPYSIIGLPDCNARLEGYRLLDRRVQDEVNAMNALAAAETEGDSSLTLEDVLGEPFEQRRANSQALLDKYFALPRSGRVMKSQVGEVLYRYDDREFLRAATAQIEEAERKAADARAQAAATARSDPPATTTDADAVSADASIVLLDEETKDGEPSDDSLKEKDGDQKEGESVLGKRKLDQSQGNQEAKKPDTTSSGTVKKKETEVILVDESEEKVDDDKIVGKFFRTPKPFSMDDVPRVILDEKSDEALLTYKECTEFLEPGVPTPIELEFRVIRNDGKRQHLEWLLHAKNIYGTQLPKMPKDYITRLVFDRNHRSLLILKTDRVVGGITFRPFFPQGFAEIAFCAITAGEQVKGYGSRLMNHLKQACKGVDLLYFLTYADNFAVGYFKKQGFSITVSLPREKWAGYIKDYDGGTLMQCHYNKNVDHLRVKEVVKLQKEAVLQRVRELSKSHLVYPGLSWKIVDNVRQPLSLSEIPGIPPSMIRERNERVSLEADRKSSYIKLRAKLRIVLSKLRAHRSSWPFLKPVDPVEVPDYYNVIKDPIDLFTIGERLENEMYYVNSHIFLADVLRMCQNCKRYNRPDTVFFPCAVEIESYVRTLIKNVQKHEL